MRSPAFSARDAGMTDRAARTRHRRFDGIGPRHRRQFIEEVAGIIVKPEQGLDLPPQGGVARAGLIQICAALIGGQFQAAAKTATSGLAVHSWQFNHPPYNTRNRNQKGAEFGYDKMDLAPT